jgi:hypothetical protein
VLAYILGCGARGSTQKEAADGLFLGRPSICARFHALEQAGRIVKLAETRDRCAVYQCAIYAAGL